MSDVFPVVCSYLDPKALLCSMNERYAKKTHTCRLWNSGVNAVYKLGTNKGNLYLRVSHQPGIQKKIMKKKFLSFMLCMSGVFLR